MRARGHLEGWCHAHVIARRIDRLIGEQAVDHLLGPMPIAVIAKPDLGAVGGLQQVVRVEFERTVRPDVRIIAARARDHASLQLRSGDLAALHRDKPLLAAAGERAEEDALAEIDADLARELELRGPLLRMLINLRIHPPSLYDTR